MSEGLPNYTDELPFSPLPETNDHHKVFRDTLPDDIHVMVIRGNLPQVQAKIIGINFNFQ